MLTMVNHTASHLVNGYGPISELTGDELRECYRQKIRSQQSPSATSATLDFSTKYVIAYPPRVTTRGKLQGTEKCKIRFL
jgi:hypothetical protein